MATVEYYFDYISPYSYLADTQLSALVERTGCVIDYKPILLGGLHQITGNRAPIDLPPKARNMVADINRWANKYGVPIQIPEGFPVFTLASVRGALVAIERGEMDRYHPAMFHAIWGQGRDISQLGVLADVIQSAGLDPSAYAEGVQSPAIKAALKQNTAAAAERDLFGAPSFIVGDEIFWGNDRLEFVEEALNAAA